MSKGAESQRTDQRYDVSRKPAVGLIATEHNADQLSRTILRATEHGHQVFVTHGGDAGLESVRFAEQLGAKIVHPHEPGLDRRALKQELASSARSESLPGIVYQPEGCERIDYEASSEAIGESVYGVEAVTESERSFTDSPSVLAAIPAYNEGKAIAEVVDDASPHADEVVVIDDGSSDATVARARDAGATVVQHATNKGYGGALKTAFREAERRDVEHLVILDGDGQHDADDIPTLVETQKETDSHIVIGSRFAEGSETEIPLYRRFGLLIVNLMTNLSMGVIRARSRVSDTQSGFRAYDRRAIESLANDESVGDQMNASTDILYHAHERGYEMAEVGTTISYDVEDASTHNPVSHGLSLVSNILQTVEHERPITVLGIPGFVSAFVGLGFGYGTFSNFLNTGTFPMGMAITAAFFTLAGIFACFTAIILHALKTHL